MARPLMETLSCDFLGWGSNAVDVYLMEHNEVEMRSGNLGFVFQDVIVQI